jgi:hypothetical protein
MSLKKIALIALIVVMLLSSVIAFGCKPKAEEGTVDSTLAAPVMDTTAVVDTAAAPVETPAPAKK